MSRKFEFHVAPAQPAELWQLCVAPSCGPQQSRDGGGGGRAIVVY
jgi:hypothetical protein